MKRLLIFLSLALLLTSFFVLSVSAEDSANTEQPVYVAECSGKQYTSLEEAMAQAAIDSKSAPQYVYLLTDIELNETLNAASLSYAIILDLNGHNLVGNASPTINNTGFFAINNGGARASVTCAVPGGIAIKSSAMFATMGANENTVIGDGTGYSLVSTGFMCTVDAGVFLGEVSLAVSGTPNAFNGVVGGSFSVPPTEYMDPSCYKASLNDEGLYEVEDYYAAIGDIWYKTLAEAVEAAKDGDTVTVLNQTYADFTVSGKSITLDINGHTVSSANLAVAITVEAGASLTVMDSKFETATASLGTNSTYETIAVYGSLTVLSGRIASKACPIAVYDGGTATLKGGIFSAVAPSADLCPKGYTISQVEGAEGKFEVTQKVVELSEIFTFQGYSLRNDGTAIAAGFLVDHELLAIYESQNSTRVDFGGVFGVEAIDEYAVTYSLSSLEPTSTYNIIITEIDQANYSTELIMSFYVTALGNTSYVTENGLGSSDAVVPTTYNSVAGTAS